jgi:hypothetical protein
LAALDGMDIRTAWEIIGENIKISVKEILGNEEQIKIG